MFTCVGARSGYCSLGSVASAPTPASITMIASTQANMGRSMKIRDIRRSVRLGRAGVADLLRRGNGHGLDRRALLQAVEALNDDLVAPYEAQRDDEGIAAAAFGGDLAALDLAALADEQDVGGAVEVV